MVSDDAIRPLAVIMDDIAAEAFASGDQPILDLVEEACDAGYCDANPVVQLWAGLRRKLSRKES